MNEQVPEKLRIIQDCLDQIMNAISFISAELDKTAQELDKLEDDQEEG